jgi:hypothetical protein
MSVLSITPELEMRRVEALLDRLDPAPHTCDVPGCVHVHAAESGPDLRAA